jgi:hypothetical protein
VGSLGTPLAWLLTDQLPAARVIAATAQLVGIAGYVSALRLYESPERESTSPHVINPTRTWARVAFGFLIVAAAVNVILALVTLNAGEITSLTLSAGRHALAQGFLMPIIVMMAARILPGYSARMIRQPVLLSWLLWTLFVGAALRTGAELVGGYQGAWAMALAAGALLSTGAFTVFAIGLGNTCVLQRGSVPRAAA